MAIQKTDSNQREEEHHGSFGCDQCLQSSDAGTGGDSLLRPPALSDLNLQSGIPLAALTTKVGSRQFQLKARVDF